MSRADRLILLTIARALERGTYDGGVPAYSSKDLAAAYLRATRWGPF